MLTSQADGGEEVDGEAHVAGGVLGEHAVKPVLRVVRVGRKRGQVTLSPSRMGRKQRHGKGRVGQSDGSHLGQQGEGWRN